MKPNTTITMGSLFAGVGGFDIAAERAGINVLWQSENDKKASGVLKYRFPTIENLGDIHGIEGAPKVDILAGGFPCQSYSIAGDRGGLAEDRGALWWEFHRLISEGKPTWVLGENVPGLLSSSGGRDFTTIIKSLVQLGYGVAWGVLDAQWFGVAQRRRRVFIVGHLGGRPRPEVLALAESMCGHPQPSRATGSTIAGSLETRPTDARRRAEEGHIVFRQQRSTDYTEDSIASTIAARDYKSSTDLVTRPTVRRLTPLECEKLQGFPDNFTNILGASDTARYKQLGNAVAIPVVEWIMRRIVQAETLDREKATEQTATRSRR